MHVSAFAYVLLAVLRKALHLPLELAIMSTKEEFWHVIRLLSWYGAV